MEQNQSGLYEVEIDGKIYEFEKWGAEQSLINLIKIAKIMGKPLGMVLGTAVEGGGLGANISSDMLSAAFQALAENMDEKICLELIKKFSAEKVLCAGRTINFNSHYQDNLGHLFKVVRAALDVQYGNFLGELTGLLGEQKAPSKGKKIVNHKT